MIFQTITRPFDRILAAKHDGRKKWRIYVFSRAARIVHVHLQAYVRLKMGFFYNIQQPSEQSRQKLHLVVQN